MRSESFPEFEELNWAVVHGRGVLHTGHANTFAKVLATAGMVSGKESYFYMRYDDSPERDNIPMMFYTVMGNPNVDIVLHEEVEPVGEVFNAIVVMDSSMLIHPTSQRTLLFDGAKEDAVLVVNTSLSPEEVIRLVKKYSLGQEWRGKLVTLKASSYDREIAYPLLAGLLKAWKVVGIGDLVGTLDSLGNGDKEETVRRVYDEVRPVDVAIGPAETFVSRSKEGKTLLLPETKWWDLNTYRKYQKAASEAKSYSERLSAMPRWEVLAPGLIEFGPSPGEKNLGFTTSFERYFRPIVDKTKCTDCKLCHLYCPDGAINFRSIEVDLKYCTGCGICSEVCPVKAIHVTSELEASEGLKEEEISTIEKALREYGY